MQAPTKTTYRVSYLNRDPVKKTAQRTHREVTCLDSTQAKRAVEAIHSARFGGARLSLICIEAVA